MFHLLILTSIVLVAWGLFLMTHGDASIKFCGSVLLIAVPVAWMIWLDLRED
jgi:hypothetical protein